MIVILALLFRRFLTGRLVRQAREQAERGLVGSMEGHAEMDMSVRGGTIWQRLRSPKGFTAVSHSFVMDWAAIWKDIFGGLLIAGPLAAWVERSGHAEGDRDLLRIMRKHGLSVDRLRAGR